MKDETLHIAEIPFPDGSIRFRYSRRLSDDGARWIRDGMFVAYHEDGSVASQGSYVDGMEEGLWRDFHPNGVVAAQGEYRRGKEVGCWRYYLNDGTLEREEAKGDAE